MIAVSLSESEDEDAPALANTYAVGQVGEDSSDESSRTDESDEQCAPPMPPQKENRIVVEVSDTETAKGPETPATTAATTKEVAHGSSSSSTASQNSRSRSPSCGRSHSRSRGPSRGRSPLRKRLPCVGASHDIQVNQDGLDIPVLHSLLTGKSAEMHQRVHQITEKLLEAPLPKDAVYSTDFEQAVIKAPLLRRDLKVGGCFFHFSQAVLRKIGDLGLRRRYDEHRGFCRRVHTLTSLAFLPPDQIRAAFDQLAPYFEDCERPLLKYFEETWIGGADPSGYGCGMACFPPILWSVNGRAVEQGASGDNECERAVPQPTARGARGAQAGQSRGDRRQNYGKGWNEKHVSIASKEKCYRGGRKEKKRKDKARRTAAAAESSTKHSRPRSMPDST